MRIAVIVGQFPELSSTFILDHVTGLLERGHDVHVFATRPRPGEPVHADFARFGLAARTHYWWGGSRGVLDSVMRSLRLLARAPGRHGAELARILLPALRPGVAPAERRLWSQAATLLCERPFDVALAQFGTNGGIAQRLRDVGALDAPLATVFLGYDLTRVPRERGAQFYADLFARGELMLPLSDHFRRRLIELGCKEDRIVVHHLGVNTRAFEFAPRALRDGEVPRLLTVCRLVEKKGLAYALRALRIVADSGVAFAYDIVGDGPLRAELESLSAELGLSSRVTFHGPMAREHVKRMLAQGHVFVSPSVTARDGDQEGTPAAIMEAMAVGLPVVSTLHSGIPEVIADGVSGHLVPERDVEALARAIERVLRTPERWVQLARAARATIEREYDVTQLNDTLARRLSELAQRRVGASVA